MKKENKNKFAKKLNEAGLSIKEFAIMWHIPYRTVQSWKLGERRVPKVALFLVNLQRVNCSFCNYTFHIDRENPPKVVYCPNCGRTSEEAKEMVDEFIFM